MAVTTAAVVGTGLAVKGQRDAKKQASAGISAQKDQNATNEAFIREQAAKAREDILPQFGLAQEARQQGAQAALDVFGQTIPQQAGVFQAGNVGAQQALLAGLPQIQNALLGRPVDLSGLQAQQLPFDTGFAQQQLPQFAASPLQTQAEIDAAAALQAPQLQQQQPAVRGGGGFLSRKIPGLLA